MTNLLWSRPPKSDIVIFDHYAIQGIITALGDHTYSIFENRRSVLHVWAILHMLMRLRVTWLEYCRSYLTLTQARVVITGIDSNHLFYELKHKLPHMKFVAVQNGSRGTGSPVKGGDLWSALGRLRRQPPTVDVIATFGSAHSRQYSSRIHCSTVEIGSARSNAIPVHGKPSTKTSPTVALISNFSGLPHSDIFPGGSASATAIFLGEQHVGAREYFSADALVAKTVSAICGSMDWEFSIVGRRAATFPHEQAFFAEACQGQQFSFRVKESETSSYEFLDGVDLVIALDSTLGYEMIARGTRVLFISARSAFINGAESRQFDFGFPGDYSKEGVFWTTSLQHDVIKEKMQSLLAMGQDQWQTETTFVRQELMVHDPDNGQLRTLLRDSLNL